MTKRHGHFFGGRTFYFCVKLAFPKKLAAAYDRRRLQGAAQEYGNVRAQKFFSQALDKHGATCRLIFSTNIYNFGIGSVSSRRKKIDPALVEKDYWIMHCLYGLQNSE